MATQWVIPDGWETVDPNDLTVDGENPNSMKKPERDALLRSLITDGWVKPIVVNLEGLIADGQQRWEIAKEGEQVLVPIVRLDIDDTDRRILRQVLNKLRGRHDPLKDALEYRKIDAAGKRTELIKRLLLSEVELRKALEPGTAGKEETYEIPALELVETDIELGDVYILGTHRLVCGDATDTDYFIKLMGEERAIIMFTDPPYNVDMGTIKHPKFKQRPIAGDHQTTEEYRRFCREAFANLLEFTDGDVYVCHAPKEDGQIVIDELLAYGVHWSTTIIWAKQHFTLGRSKYHSRYEPIFYGWNGDSTYVGGRKESNVWNIDRPTKSDLHPTMKPIPLCARAITNSTMPKDIVLDSFGGSGSTLIACEQTDRHCRMMEIDPRYCQIIIDRWEAYTGLTVSKEGGTP